MLLVRDIPKIKLQGSTEKKRYLKLCLVNSNQKKVDTAFMKQDERKKELIEIKRDTF